MGSMNYSNPPIPNPKGTTQKGSKEEFSLRDERWPKESHPFSKGKKTGSRRAHQEAPLPA